MPIILLYLCSNIVLNSPWVKGRVARSLEVRTGQVWQIGTLNWTPNGTVHVHDLSSELGDGSLTVDHILVRPNFEQLRKRRLRFSSIEVMKPTLDVSSEWLLSQIEHIQAKPQEDEQPDLPVVASNDLENSNSSSGDSVASPSVDTEDDEVSTDSKPSLRKIEVKPVADTQTKLKEVPFEYDAWLRISDAELIVRSATGELLKLEGVSANIPYGGKELHGDVTCQLIEIAGRKILEDGGINLRKEGPVLRVGETDLDFFGVAMKPDLRIIRGIDGFHFVADLQLPQQEVEELVSHTGLTLGVSIGELAGRVQGGGRIDKPLTWRGGAALGAKDLSVVEGHRGSLVHFDHLFAHSQLQRGVMVVPNFEIMGEDLSVMGNGVATMNGIGFGVVRVVSSPGKASWIEKLSKGSQFFEETGKPMQPFNSVDRYFMDLHFDGTVFQPVIKVNQVTDWQPLWPAIKRLITFVKAEREEELEPIE